MMAVDWCNGCSVRLHYQLSEICINVEVCSMVKFSTYQKNTFCKILCITNNMKVSVTEFNMNKLNSVVQKCHIS